MGLIGRTALLALLALSAVACASSGKQIDTASIYDIEPGVTTEDDIRAMFGEPDRQKIKGSGEYQWLYLKERIPVTETTDDVLDSATDWARVAGVRTPRMPSTQVGNRDRGQRSGLAVDFDPEGTVVDFQYSGE